MLERMSNNIRRIIGTHLVHLATSSKDGRPNVVPVGAIGAISDHELLIVDVLFHKTRRNLEENPQVAIAVEALDELKAYQLKGKARVFTEGEMYERAFEIIRERRRRRKKGLSESKPTTPDIAERRRKLRKRHRRLKPKATVLVGVEEIYSTMGGP